MKESRKEAKAVKKAYKKARSKALRPWKWITWFSVPFAVVLTVATIVVSMFDNTIALFTGGTFWEVENADCLSDTEKTDFNGNLERVKWTLKRLGKRIIINGYDDVTKRGRYYIYDEEKDTLFKASNK